MIIKEAIGIGVTVEAAQEDAVSKLGAGIEEDIKFDIICFPKKKTLGLFGGSEAKVKAYVEGPDAPKTNENKKQNKNNDKKPKIKEKSQIVKEPKQEKKAEQKAEPVEVVGIPAAEVDPASPAGKAYAYLVNVLEKLGCTDVDAVVSEVEGGSKITLTGSDKLGVIIGRRGETLDALQYLASLIANEKGSGYYRLVLDIGNYREKREGTLEALAKRTANQVLRTGRSRSLEPMNPYERRIIHTTVQDIEGVTSSSVGDGSNRRVVLIPEGKANRSGNRNSRGQKSSGGARTNPVAIETEQQAKPKETDGMKLYGKIDK